MSGKDIKKLFPHLYGELQNGEVKIPINAVRKNAAEAESEAYIEDADQDECECDKCHEPLEEIKTLSRIICPISYGILILNRRFSTPMRHSSTSRRNHRLLREEGRSHQRIRLRVACATQEGWRQSIWA